jgi:hypothetical protein
MKTLKFRQKLSRLILDGKKTTTWRLFDDKDLSIGDQVSFVVFETGKEFARVELVFVKEITFGQLTELDWEGHERFDSDEQMYEMYERYYDCKVDKNSLVKIIKFRFL